jgi:hypothetical protein
VHPGDGVPAGVPDEDEAGDVVLGDDVAGEELDGGRPPVSGLADRSAAADVFRVGAPLVVQERPTFSLGQDDRIVGGARLRPGDATVGRLAGF